MNVETFELSAHNGEPINLTRMTPVAKPLGAVLIVPAMATKARYYQSIGEWLVTRGYLVYTFDYQGYGASARTPLREVKADVLTWAEDAATVVKWVRGDAGELTLAWLGHSLGGQLLPFARPELLDQAIIVACGTGYWRNAEGIDRLLAPALWWVIAPVLIALFGYYPGRKIKLLGDIPAPVMRQWASWCKKPDYLLSVMPEHRETFASMKLPLTSLSFTDDKTMSAKATAHLESFYTGTQLDARRLSPADLGESVGHMGFFSRGKEGLWERVLLPLLEKENFDAAHSAG